MHRYIRFLGWGLLVAAAVYIAAGYLVLAIVDGAAALIAYLSSFDLLTLGGVFIALLPGFALIKLGGWLEKRQESYDFDMSEEEDIRAGLDIRDEAGGELVCDVCSSATAVGVFSSRYGPVSHAACAACRDEGAETMFMACFHIHRAGGPETARERFAGMRSYHDGRYIGLDEILTLYPDFADEFEDASE